MGTMEENANGMRKRAIDTLELMMGPEILGYMHDDDVFEITVNPDGVLYIDTFSEGRYATGSIVPAEKARQVIFQAGFLTKQTCDDKFPMLAAELPDGSRFQGFLPRVVTSPSYVIRKHLKRVLSLDDYVQQAIITPEQKKLIEWAVKERKNIVVAGGTKSGKTTFLNAILQEMSKYDDRVVMIEDLPALKCAAKNIVSLRTTDTVDQHALLKSTLRASPDRIVVGEVRGAEALALLDAWGTGHNGGCSTVHSNSASQTLARLEQLVTRVSLTRQQETVGEAVDIVIYLKVRGGKRYVEEMIAVDGFDSVNQKYIIKPLGERRISA